MLQSFSKWNRFRVHLTVIAREKWRKWTIGKGKWKVYSLNELSIDMWSIIGYSKVDFPGFFAIFSISFPPLNYPFLKFSIFVLLLQHSPIRVCKTSHSGHYVNRIHSAIVELRGNQISLSFKLHSKTMLLDIKWDQLWFHQLLYTPKNRFTNTIILKFNYVIFGNDEEKFE